METGDVERDAATVLEQERTAMLARRQMKQRERDLAHLPKPVLELILVRLVDAAYQSEGFTSPWDEEQHLQCSNEVFRGIRIGNVAYTICNVCTDWMAALDPAPIWRNIIRMIDPYDAFGYLYSQYITMTTAERLTNRSTMPTISRNSDMRAHTFYLITRVFFCVPCLVNRPLYLTRPPRGVVHNLDPQVWWPSQAPCCLLTHNKLRTWIPTTSLGFVLVCKDHCRQEATCAVCLREGSHVTQQCPYEPVVMENEDEHPLYKMSAAGVSSAGLGWAGGVRGLVGLSGREHQDQDLSSWTGYGSPPPGSSAGLRVWNTCSGCRQAALIIAFGGTTGPVQGGVVSQNAPPPSITLLQTLGGPNFSRADADTRGALESYAELGEGEIGALVGMAGDKVWLARGTKYVEYLDTIVRSSRYNEEEAERRVRRKQAIEREELKRQWKQIERQQAREYQERQRREEAERQKLDAERRRHEDERRRMEEHEARCFEEEEEEEEEMEEVVAAPVQYRNAARHEHKTVQEVLESADAEQERDVESDSDGEALWKRLGVEKVAEQPARPQIDPRLLDEEEVYDVDAESAFDEEMEEEVWDEVQDESDTENVANYAEEQSARELALGDWARSRILEGVWTSPFDEERFAQNVTPLISPSAPLEGILPILRQQLSVTHPLAPSSPDAVLDADVPVKPTKVYQHDRVPTLHLAHALSRAHFAAMRMVLLPALSNVIRRMVWLTCDGDVEKARIRVCRMMHGAGSGASVASLDVLDGEAGLAEWVVRRCGEERSWRAMLKVDKTHRHSTDMPPPSSTSGHRHRHGRTPSDGTAPLTATESSHSGSASGFGSVSPPSTTATTPSPQPEIEPLGALVAHTVPWVPTVEAVFGRPRLNPVPPSSSEDSSPTPTQPPADEDEPEPEYPLGPMQTDTRSALERVFRDAASVLWTPPEGTAAEVGCCTCIVCVRELCKAAGVDVGMAALWGQEAEQPATVNPASVTIRPLAPAVDIVPSQEIRSKDARSPPGKTTAGLKRSSSERDDDGDQRATKRTNRADSLYTDHAVDARHGVKRASVDAEDDADQVTDDSENPFTDHHATTERRGVQRKRQRTDSLDSERIRRTSASVEPTLRLGGGAGTPPDTGSDRTSDLIDDRSAPDDTRDSYQELLGLNPGIAEPEGEESYTQGPDGVVRYRDAHGNVFVVDLDSPAARSPVPVQTPQEYDYKYNGHPLRQQQDLELDPDLEEYDDVNNDEAEFETQTPPRKGTALTKPPALSTAKAQKRASAMSVSEDGAGFEEMDKVHHAGAEMDDEEDEGETIDEAMAAYDPKGRLEFERDPSLVAGE